MENKVVTTEETTQIQLIYKRIHRAKLAIDILLWCIVGFLAFVGLNFWATGRLEQFLEEKALILILPLIASVTAGVVLSGYLDNCYRQYRCKSCGHIHQLSPSELDNHYGEFLFCTECDKKTRYKKVPFHDAEVKAKTDKVKTTLKKPWVIVLICVCVISMFVFCGKPIVLTVRHDGSTVVYSSNPGGVLIFSLDKHGVQYYLADGSDPDNYDVFYLNREPESLLDALQEGHIDMDDLERFGLEYGIISQ